MKLLNYFRKGTLLYSLCIIVFGCTIVYFVVKAGSLTPLSDPAATSYTLSDIYTRLTTNEAAIEADHDFSPGSAPASSFYTLTQIYEAIPTILANTVKSGTPYLGITGTLLPNGGTAAVADLFSGKTANLTGDWSLDTGTLNLACNIATFNGTANLVDNVYDGGGNGSNRWCMTDSGDAVATEIASGKIAWVDGQAITGSMANNGAFSLSCGATNQSVTVGYYSGGTLTGDADLINTNIKSGVNIFSIDGNLLPSGGTATTTDVCTTKTYYGENQLNWTLATGAMSIDGSKVLTGTTYCGTPGTITNVGAQTITPSTSNIAITAGYHNGTGYCSGDPDLISSNIKNSTNIFGVVGNFTGAYTWTKTGSGSTWEGVNENLLWDKEIGGTNWWASQTFSFCDSVVCTNDGYLTSAANYSGTPGGWNGATTSNFLSTALHNYEVITTDGVSLNGDCSADTGDLVFPDGSVWDKSNVKPYSIKLTGCDSNDSNAALIWAAAGGTGSQYAYARNVPSALSIADAWDGKKNLTTGANDTHAITANGINDEYYASTTISWYANTGDGVGTSRLPTIKEYVQATLNVPTSASASLLWGTTNWSQNSWSAEQIPANSSFAMYFFPLNINSSYNSVNFQFYRLWVVVAQ